MVAAVFVYASMHQALGRSDAVVLFILVPVVALSVCSGLFILALKHHSRRVSAAPEYALSTAWAFGAALGLFGMLFAAVVGPHLAGFLAYFLGGQVLLSIAAHVSRLRKQ